MELEITPSTCPHCGTVVSVDMVACPNCHLALKNEPSPCPFCGGILQTNLLFCPDCETVLAPPLTQCPHCQKHATTLVSTCSSCRSFFWKGQSFTPQDFVQPPLEEPPAPKAPPFWVHWAARPFLTGLFLLCSVIDLFCLLGSFLRLPDTLFMLPIFLFFAIFTVLLFVLIHSDPKDPFLYWGLAPIRKMKKSTFIRRTFLTAILVFLVTFYGLGLLVGWVKLP